MGSIGFLLRRVLQAILVLWLVTLVTFVLVNVVPGAPQAALGIEQTVRERTAVYRQYGLDRDPLTRYADWLGNALRGDLGNSFSLGLPVTRLLLQRLPNTALLAFSALLLAAVAGVALGAVAAVYRGRWPDHVLGAVSTLGLATPTFWIGIVALILFSVEWQLLPASGMYSRGAGGGTLADRLRHLVLPAGTLAFSAIPNIMRITRAAILEVIHNDHVRTARSKGLREWPLLGRHVLRNALVPIIAALGMVSTSLLSGSVVVESVFGWPGLGRLVVDATASRDQPVILGATVLIALVVAAIGITVDLLYTKVDPRIRRD